MSRGYVIVSQWHSLIKHIDELMDRSKHTGDAASIDRVTGWSPPRIHESDPGCSIGQCVMRIENDGSLTKVRAYYDTSD